MGVGKFSSELVRGLVAAALAVVGLLVAHELAEGLGVAAVVHPGVVDARLFQVE